MTKRPTNRMADRQSGRPTDKTADRPTKRPTDRAADRMIDQFGALSVLSRGGRAYFHPDDRMNFCYLFLYSSYTAPSSFSVIFLRCLSRCRIKCAIVSNCPLHRSVRYPIRVKCDVINGIGLVAIRLLDFFSPNYRHPSFSLLDPTTQTPLTPKTHF